MDRCIALCVDRCMYTTEQVFCMSDLDSSEATSLWSMFSSVGSRTQIKEVHVNIECCT